MKFLTPELVSFHHEASSAEEAIGAAGTLLVQEGVVAEGYLTAMQQSFRENGPYIVLAPQVALPHARPEDGVFEAAVSLVQLKKPVEFGHLHNDPVRLVFGLAAASDDDHIRVLQRLSLLLGVEEKRSKLMEAGHYKDIEHLLGGDES